MQRYRTYDYNTSVSLFGIALWLTNYNIFFIEDIMKSITTATAAAAIGIPSKRLDNILAREARGLLPSGAQGRARRVSVEVIEIVSLGMVLGRDLGVPMAKALELASRLLASPTRGVIEFGALGRLQFDVGRLRRAIEDAVTESIEQTPTPPRGRPRTRRD